MELVPHTRPGRERGGGERERREGEGGRQGINHNPSSKLSPSPSSITHIPTTSPAEAASMCTKDAYSWGTREPSTVLVSSYVQKKVAAAQRETFSTFGLTRNITSVIKLSRISTPWHYSNLPNMHCSLVTFLTSNMTYYHGNQMVRKGSGLIWAMLTCVAKLRHMGGTYLWGRSLLPRGLFRHKFY